MQSPLRTRRSFLQDLALGIAVAPFVTRGLMAQSPNSKVLHATFGCDGMGLADIKEIGKQPGVEVVAGCDVDSNRIQKFLEKFPNAHIYSDYRELLDKEKGLQSVNVSTPDHMHAAMGMAAMDRGIHVYGQKPLTHNLHETRRLVETAREKKIKTQMGIQVHSSTDYRTSKKLIRDGVIGKVKEVHTWCEKGWGDNGDMPSKTDTPPENLNWDLWLGVASERPYIAADEWYHPGNWRKRVDFGTGTLGDMACHLFDPIFTALDIKAPISVRSEGAAPSAHSWKTDAKVQYVFPGTEFTDGKTLEVTWYDGSQIPPKHIIDLAFPKDDQYATFFPPKNDGKPLNRNNDPMKWPELGSIIVGTKGVMVLTHYGSPRIVGAGFKDFVIEKVEGVDHWGEFIEVVKGDKPAASANFDYAGPLTEAVLLGSVGVRFPQTELQWDSAKLNFTNHKAANEFIRRQYRKGWEVAGL